MKGSLKKAGFLVIMVLLSLQLLAVNVTPVITDPIALEATKKERDKIFSALIDDPTNLDNLFTYANLCILLGDLEAAIGVFEQMLIYEPDLARIRLELGVLYFRLNALPSAKLYLNSVKEYDPPKEVLEKVDEFLEAIAEEEAIFQVQQVIGTGLKYSGNANSGIDADIIEIAGFPLEVSPDSKGQSDLANSLRYNLTANQDLQHPRGDTENYLFSLSNERFDTFDQFDLSSVVFSINRIFNLQESLIGILSSPLVTTSYTGFMVLLADKPLLTSHRVELDYAGSLSDNHFLSIGYYHDKRKFSDNNLKSWNVNGVEIGNTFIVKRNDVLLEVNYNFDKYNSVTPWENYNFRALDIKTSKKIRGNWVFSSSLNHSRKSYYHPAPVFGVRDDKVNSFKVGFSKSLSPCWASNYNLSSNQNKSSIDIYQKKNTQLTMDYSYLCLGTE